MPKMHIWLNLNMAHKNRLKSKDRSALPLTHVTTSQQLTEIRKNGMARAICPPNALAGAAMDCTCVLQPKPNDLITKQHEV
jgi:hypothetical protein